jgi:hypothetical protein
MVAIESVEHGTCPSCGCHVHHSVLVNEKGELLRRRTRHAERRVESIEPCRYDVEPGNRRELVDAFPGDL